MQHARTRSRSSNARQFEQSRMRLLCVGLFFALCFTTLSLRLVEMMFDARAVKPSLSIAQLAQGDGSGEDAEVTGSDKGITRRDIVDRNGVLVATSLMTASAFANPQELSDIGQAADQLSRTLGMDKTLLQKRLNGGKSFVWIKRNLTPKEQKAVNNLGLPGVYFLPEERRVYPYANVFSHVLGYVGVDNKGLSGIEKRYDRELTEAHHDPLKLTVDARVQSIVHDEVESTMRAFNAIAGIGVVTDVNTGEVVAMVSLPDFNPHKPGSAVDDARFNRATQGAYEMGSTFKSFTTALGYESGTAAPTSRYDASPLKYANFTITDTHPENRPLTVPEIFAHSSNVGTARLLLDIGIAKQKEFMKKMGMLDPLEIDYPAHASPLYPKEWTPLSGITISYGHGISVTPMHLVRGVSALVNGGTLPPLHLVQDQPLPRKQERVVSEDTSALMRDMFRLVVTHGTAKKANVSGYLVGGKTGTAEKITAAGGYNKDDKIASFIGVFPIDKPKYSVLVMIDSPKGNASTYGFATGGWVSAPAVGNVISRMGPLLAIAPQHDVQEDHAERYWVEAPAKKPIQVAKKPEQKGVTAAAYTTH